MHLRSAYVPVFLLRLALAGVLLCAFVLMESAIVRVASADEPYLDPTPAPLIVPADDWPLSPVPANDAAPAPAQIETPTSVPAQAEPPTAEPPTFSPVPVVPYNPWVMPIFTQQPEEIPPSSTPTRIPPTRTRTSIPTATATSTPSWLPPGPGCSVKPGKVVLKLDVPYIHQVNDIDNADGNWACGPTSVAMVLAYYGKLQPWPGTAAASGSTDGSEYAPYVTQAYTNNDHTYSALAADPEGKKVAGLYGSICPTGLADWSLIRRVLEWHGLSSKAISVSFESVKAALKRGHPVLIGNALTAEGHILVAVGYTSNNQLIVNDPYGNRFAYGYGSTSGKFLYYAWNCLRARNAVEVIGVYPPPVTPSPTAEPTFTSTPTSTATSTLPPTSTVVGSPTSTPGSKGLLGSNSSAVQSPPSAASSNKNAIAADVMGLSSSSSSSTLVASTATTSSGRKALAFALMTMSLIIFLAGLYWWFVHNREDVQAPHNGPRERRSAGYDRIELAGS